MTIQLSMFEKTDPVVVPGKLLLVTEHYATCQSMGLSHDDSLKSIFRHMSAVQRTSWLRRYRELLSIENGTYKPGRDLMGKERPYPQQFPWMKKIWENGMKLLMEVMSDLNESVDEVQ